MKIVRGIAAGSVVVASLSVFAGCFLDWDLDAPASSDEGGVDATTPLISDSSSSGAPDTGPATHGCTTNADCNGGLCYFASGACNSGAGRCVIAAAACANGAGGTTTTPGGGQICTCSNETDACAPTHAVTACPGASATSTACGFLSCPSTSSFCEVSDDGQRYECKAWTGLACPATGGTGEHTCACAKKACDGGTCTASASNIVLTCP